MNERQSTIDIAILRKVLRLQWSDLAEDCEIVLVEDNPHRSRVYGLINLEHYRVTKPTIIEPNPPEAVPYYEFKAHRRRVGQREIVFLLIEKIEGVDYVARLYTPEL